MVATIRTPEGGDSLYANIVVTGFKHKIGAKVGSIGYETEIAPTLNAGQTSAVYDARGNSLTGDHQDRVTVSAVFR